MSLVVAMKHKDRFILGADKQVTCGWNKKSHNGTKVWYTDIPGCCMGAVGSARGAQIIADTQGLLDGLPFGSVEIPKSYITSILPKVIYEVLKDGGIDCKIEDETGKYLMLPCAFFFAYRDKCWCINQDLTVDEVEDYMAIGSGEECASASLDTAVIYKEKNPFRMIVNAIDIAAERTIHVDHDVDFVQTIELDSDAMQELEALDPENAKLFKAVIKEQKLAAKQVAEETPTEEPVVEEAPAEETKKKKTAKKKKAKKNNAKEEA